jgi:catechol 2,3-dioxygenase-like lactoylglutathione lyase family enzyme
LEPLGVGPTHDSDQIIAWDDFAILPAGNDGRVTRHLHVGFVAPSREHVDAFWKAGVEAGYRDDGAPGPRAQYKPDYYGAFLLDPDGNSAEAVHHGDTRRGGHIDHLWIGVGDLATAVIFYNLISRHTGLREGRRWPEGQQFRGAWATFSLVADGRAPTENLHIAFPAPDRETVDEFHAAATSAGYTSDGAPGERPRYGPGYYAAYVRDPDGTSIESVFREHGMT